MKCWRGDPRQRPDWAKRKSVRAELVEALPFLSRWSKRRTALRQAQGERTRGSSGSKFRNASDPACATQLAMTDTPFPALTRAAEAAIAYRTNVAAAETTPVASYADILDAFAGPLPESGGDAEAIIAELIERATPGIRASTGPRFFGCDCPIT